METICLQDFSNVQYVNIMSKAKLTIDSSLNIRQLSELNDVDRVSKLIVACVFLTAISFYRNYASTEVTP